MTKMQAETTGEATTIGTVTGHRIRRSGGLNRLLFPVVSFETQDGRTVEFESGTGSNIPPRAGEAVTVVYDPLRPETARITAGSVIRFRSETFVVLGMLVLGVVGLPVLAFLAMLLLMLL